jgi:hypothetical protein
MTPYCRTGGTGMPSRWRWTAYGYGVLRPAVAGGVAVAVGGAGWLRNPYASLRYGAGAGPGGCPAPGRTGWLGAECCRCGAGRVRTPPPWTRCWATVVWSGCRCSPFPFPGAYRRGRGGPGSPEPLAGSRSGARPETPPPPVPARPPHSRTHRYADTTARGDAHGTGITGITAITEPVATRGRGG